MKRPRYEQLSKAFVAGYTRRTATGQMVHVGGYHNRRTRRAAPLPTPERITAAYGDEVGRDTVTGARGDPFLIRQFGRGKRQAFVVHAANGEHIGTLRVAMGPRGAQVKDSWTHPQWGDRGVHVPMLRRLVADHAQVYSPAEMDPDLHRAWHALEGTHSVTQETHGAHIYHRLGPQEQAALFKSVEAGATRGPEGGELEKSLQKALAPVVQALVKSWPGERERHREAAKQGRRNKPRFDLRPVPTQPKAEEVFRALYMRKGKRLYARNWRTGAVDLRVIFDPTRPWHATTRRPDDFAELRQRHERELGRKLTKAEVEKLRVFDPRRAERLHWIGAVLRNPQAIYKATDRQGRHGFLLLSAGAKEDQYIVFVQEIPDSQRVAFVTAYPVDQPQDVTEALRLGSCLYQQDQQRKTRQRCTSHSVGPA